MIILMFSIRFPARLPIYVTNNFTKTSGSYYPNTTDIPNLNYRARICIYYTEPEYLELEFIISNGTTNMDFTIAGYFTSSILNTLDAAKKTVVASNLGISNSYIKNTDVLSGWGTLNGVTFYTPVPMMAMYFA